MLRLAGRMLPADLMWCTMNLLDLRAATVLSAASKATRTMVHHYVREALRHAELGKSPIPAHCIYQHARRLTSLVYESGRRNCVALKGLLQYNRHTLETVLLSSGHDWPPHILVALSGCPRLTRLSLRVEDSDTTVGGKAIKEALDALMEAVGRQLRDLTLHTTCDSLVDRVFLAGPAALEAYSGTAPAQLALLRHAPRLTTLCLEVRRRPATWQMIDLCTALPHLGMLTTFTLGAPSDDDDEGDEFGGGEARTAQAAPLVLPSLRTLCIPDTRLQQLPPIRAPHLREVTGRVFTADLFDLLDHCPELTALQCGDPGFRERSRRIDTSWEPPRLSPSKAEALSSLLLTHPNVRRWAETLTTLALLESQTPTQVAVCMASALRSLTCLHLVVPAATSPPSLTRYLLASLPRLVHFSVRAAAPEVDHNGRARPEPELSPALLQQISAAAAAAPVPLELSELLEAEVSLCDEATFVGLYAPKLAHLNLHGSDTRVDLATVRRAAPHLITLRATNVGALAVPPDTEPFERCTAGSFGPSRDGFTGSQFVRLLQLLPQLATLKVNHLLSSRRSTLHFILGCPAPPAHLRTVHLLPSPAIDTDSDDEEDDDEEDEDDDDEGAADEDEKGLVWQAFSALPSLHSVFTGGSSLYRIDE